MKRGIIALILLSLIFIIGASGCQKEIPRKDLYYGQTNITIIAHVDRECNGKMTYEDGLTIPINSLSLPINTPEEAHMIAKMATEYCNFNILLDNSTIRRSDPDPQTNYSWHIDFEDLQPRPGDRLGGIFSINDQTGDISMHSFLNV